MQTLDDGVALPRALESGHPRSAAVVGGGYIGLEVSLIDAGEQSMSTLGPDMGVLVSAICTSSAKAASSARSSWKS
ncbi:hypothetical protein GCM10023075_35130 [Streptosporangium album]|uniref:hypothetical protein n=1 Tax=Streptosporangium album TaxID=47479 RepID=UPI0031EB6762